MVLGPRLALKTSQTLVISPQLQAAIKLLTLSNLDLQAAIASELDQNPLLEMEGELEERRGEEAPDGGEEASSEPTLVEELSNPFDSESLDIDFANDCFLDDCIPDSAPIDNTGHDFLLSQFEGEGESLAAALLRQADGLRPAERVVAVAIIAGIDRTGYLTEPLSAIAAALGLAESEVEEVLLKVQGFEPTGVGARSLTECLALQAQAVDRYDPAMAMLLANLEVVARGDIAALCRLCDVDAEDMAEMLQELRAYDPKPGLRFGGEVAATIVPDIIVRRQGDTWVAELNGETLPHVVFNHALRDGLKKELPEKSGRRFVRHCVSRGNWLLKTLQQRAATILAVASEIVSFQQEFFSEGVRCLKPLTLGVIAQTLGVHESTVSRVVSNKYLTCERGTFELRYFFTAAILNADGSETSAEAIRERIRALVAQEPPTRPLSDGKLVALLEEEGHTLARRTVAKYREAIGIPSSFDRRRLARLKGE